MDGMREMIDDLTDVYLSRSLKNWAAAQQWQNHSRSNGFEEARAQLLALASRIQPEGPVSLFRAHFWWNRRMSFFPEDVLETVSFTQSRTWSRHLVENAFVYTC